QRAAIAALTADPKEVDYMKQEFLRRRGIVLEALKEIPGLVCNVPQGAFYVFADASAYLGKAFNGKIMNDAKDLCMYLAYEAHVVITPGSAFGMPEFIRIS